ncbi:acyltransferase [Mucisphaera calidilacus]|uniref:Streptogramin A acetyltransferase n=1 Tax=Mucisphaera calidilacus TaxID=2527982 RepID=A0A518BV27_9BACT|nr:DapH/DapD/GlmU-related protein [Mucisphaera calidilacus]QDU70843.1 Streptogramin A acetyltransferase [Mucisphaera calidilacus]
MLSALKKKLRENEAFYLWLRSTRMAVRRWRKRLRHVHPTFYCPADAIVLPDLQADAYSYVGTQCIVGPRVHLGRYVMLGPRVMIVGDDHVFDRAGVPIIFAGRPPELHETVIEDDAWVGAGTIIMAGVRIGRGAIVAAGAVVTRDVPPFEIHAGIPAKKLKDRFERDEDRQAHEQLLDGPDYEGHFCPPMG